MTKNNNIDKPSLHYRVTHLRNHQPTDIKIFNSWLPQSVTDADNYYHSQRYPITIIGAIQHYTWIIFGLCLVLSVLGPIDDFSAKPMEPTLTESFFYLIGSLGSMTLPIIIATYLYMRLRIKKNPQAYDKSTKTFLMPTRTMNTVRDQGIPDVFNRGEQARTIYQHHRHAYNGYIQLYRQLMNYTPDTSYPSPEYGEAQKTLDAFYDNLCIRQQMYACDFNKLNAPNIAIDKQRVQEHIDAQRSIQAQHRERIQQMRALFRTPLEDNTREYRRILRSEKSE